MRRLLILVFIAIILSHSVSARSGSLASNCAFEKLAVGGGQFGADLPSEGFSASLSPQNEVDLPNKGESKHRIASTVMALDVGLKKDRLDGDEVNDKRRENGLLSASSDMESHARGNLDRLFSGIDVSDDIPSYDSNIAGTDLTSDLSSNLARIGADETDTETIENNFRSSSLGLEFDTKSSLGRLLSEIEDDDGRYKRNDPFLSDFYIASYASVDQSHLQNCAERFALNGVFIIGDGADLESLNYLYESAEFVDEGSTYLLYDISSGTDYVQAYSTKEVLRKEHRSDSVLSTDHLNKLDRLITTSAEAGCPEVYFRPEVDQNLDLLIQKGISDEQIVSHLPNGWGVDQETGDKREKNPMNYAVVVGINNYADWGALRSPVNDAHEISEILETCDYNVLELTDETELKPTKENILSAALDDINTEEIDGKIIFYFSGHGVRSDDGTFYLVPQDAKSGDLSSCISELELRRYLRDLDNLAVIIDACNSGGLKIADEGQLVLTSSKEYEPSNEKWFGSLSVFTYNLCKAIEGKMLSNENISLNECFYSARDDTIRWANWRLISQTPEMIDLAGGNYYLR